MSTAASTSPPLFTVFTPTHQRATTLHRPFESLQRQTHHDFEWLVVDDGSTDGTAELLESYRARARFPVRGFAQPHRGRPAAYNLALAEARGTLLIVLDSDDECDPDALAHLAELWWSIPADRRAHFLGVSTAVRDQHGRRQGRLPEPVLDTSLPDLRYRYRVRGERWAALRLDILREHPYPEIEGVRRMTPGMLAVRWPDLPVRASQRAVRVWWCDEPGRSDQLSRRPAAAHPHGHALWHLGTLDRHLGWFRHDPVSFVRTAINLARFSFLEGRSARDTVRRPQHLPARLLVALVVPVAWLVARYDRIVARRAGGRNL